MLVIIIRIYDNKKMHNTWPTVNWGEFGRARWVTLDNFSAPETLSLYTPLHTRLGAVPSVNT